MHARAIIATVLTPFLALACGEGTADALTSPDRDASLLSPSVDRAEASASQTEIAFAICPTGDDPGTARVTGQVLHVRESMAEVTLLGDLEGEEYGLFDLDLQLDGFTGPARGHFRFELTRLLGNEIEDGGFAGRHHGRQGPGFSGLATGHGFGDLEGLKIRYTFEGRGPGRGFAQWGVITDPTGSLTVTDKAPAPPSCDRVKRPKAHIGGTS